MLDEKISEVPELMAIQLTREAGKADQRRKAIEKLSKRPAFWIYLPAIFIASLSAQYAFKTLPDLTGAVLTGLLVGVVGTLIQMTFLENRLNLLVKLVVESNSAES